MKKILLMTLIGALSMSFIACPKKDAPMDEQTEAPTDATDAVDAAKNAAEGAADKAIDEAAKAAKDKIPSGL